MKIVVFTGIENNGGIQQFAHTIVREIAELGHQVNLFLPDIQSIHVSDDLVPKVVRYHKVDCIFPKSKKIKQIARRIQSFAPDVVICPDDSIIACQILGALDSKVKKCITIHDVTPHPAKFVLRRKLVSAVWRWYREYGLKKADKVALLSQNSHNRFQEHHSKYATKAVVCALGAHPPIAEEARPTDLQEMFHERFALFFGRIDKYKGISRLLSAYQAAYEENNNVIPLVIAGNGALTEEDEQIIDNNPQISLIHRFIENSEMLWLLKNCAVIVLPYIEASQSGVTPLAYYFGKPVIASNIPGLKECVITGKTGFLFDSTAELKNYILDDTIEWASMRAACLNYYKENLEWTNNLAKLISAITEGANLV